MAGTDIAGMIVKKYMGERRKLAVSRIKNSKQLYLLTLLPQGPLRKVTLFLD